MRHRPTTLLAITAVAILGLAAVGCASDQSATSTSSVPSATPAATTGATAAPTGSPTIATTIAPTTTEPQEVLTLPEPIPEATPNDLGLTAVLDQFREDEILHLLQVRIHNTGSQAVRVTSIRLAWAGLTEMDPVQRDHLVSPGQFLDVPIPFGDAVCGENPPGAREKTPTDPAVAEATVLLDDTGSPVVTKIPIADQIAILAKVYPQDCRRQRVVDAVGIEYGAAWVAVTANGKPALSGTIEFTRAKGDRDIVVTRLDGSVLLRVNPQDNTAKPIMRLAPGSDFAELLIVIEQSGRCDAHALTESKKTYILPVEVSLDGERAIAYDLFIPVALRTRFGDMINESCGVG